MTDTALINARATQAAIDAAEAAASPASLLRAAPQEPTPEPAAAIATDTDAAVEDDAIIDEPAIPTDPADPDARTLPELAQQIVRRPPLLDPGWLWLIAGITLVCFTLVIPAQRDLEEARYFRDRVHAAEDHRQDRLARYQNYLGALDRADETLVLSLAAMQLNKAPKGTDLLVPGYDISKRSASVFTNLEPPPLVLPERPKRELSLLEKWTSDDRSRLWLLGGGSLMILIGLLPATTRRG